jgi:glycolate oxidase
MPEMLARVDAASRRHDIVIANIAHAGDVNLHPLLLTRAGEDAARVRAHAAFEKIITDTLELRGTVTGEHKVGLLKRAGMRAELSQRCWVCTTPSRRRSTRTHPQPGKVIDA